MITFLSAKESGCEEEEEEEDICEWYGRERRESASLCSACAEIGAKREGEDSARRSVLKGRNNEYIERFGAAAT